MTNKKRTGCIFIFLILATISMPLFSNDIYTLISEDDLSLELMQFYFDAAFYTTDFDSDGDLLIKSDSGMKTFISIKEETSLITFFSIWSIKESIELYDKLKFANKINNELVYVKFSISSRGDLFCESHILFEGGVSPYTIIKNYKLFELVVKAAISTKDVDDYIGND